MPDTDYTPLPEDVLRAIAIAYYSNRARQAVKVDKPVIVLVGGQPGAGKTSAAHVAKKDLLAAGGLIHIDADKFHSRLPNADQYDPTQTHADCKRIADFVRELAIQGRRNILQEGLFRKTDDLTHQVEAAHRNGYRCEVIAMAVSREESRLSVLERREAFRDAYGYVRDVSEEKQDAAFEGFTTNICNAVGLDRVRVVTRAGAVIYDSHGQSRCRSIGEALAYGRKLSAQQVTDFTRRWQSLKKECENKGVPQSEQARVVAAQALFRKFVASRPEKEIAADDEHER
jgi:chloramphenicol 3-O-phosphotransferase